MVPPLISQFCLLIYLFTPIYTYLLAYLLTYYTFSYKG